MILITYYYEHYKDHSTDGYHYDIADNMKEWLIDCATLKDPYGKRFLINSVTLPNDADGRIVDLVD